MSLEEERITDLCKQMTEIEKDMIEVREKIRALVEALRSPS